MATDLLTFFHLHPVFTREEVVRHLAKRGTEHPQTVANLLRHHVSQGRILRVRKGLYTSVPPGGDPETLPVDPFLVASRAHATAVIGYHSALELHGMAYSTFEMLIYLCPHPARPWTWRGVNYRPVGLPLALLRNQNDSWGVTKVDRQGLDVSVTSLERTLVDVLDRPDLGGGWEEIWRSLESYRFMDVDRVVTYSGLLKNAATASRVGFFLEQHQQTLQVSETQLQALEQMCPKQAHYLDHKRGGRLAKRWNLVVPESVWQRAWEEGS